MDANRSPTEPLFLGLDLGTTNIKALVVDERGGILGRGAESIRLIHGPQSAVEQDFEEIWVATVQAILRAIRGIETHRVRALGISSQGAAMQLLDDEGRIRGPVVSWLDGRGLAHDTRLTRQQGAAWFAHRIGHWGSSMTLGQLERLREQSPAGFDSSFRVGFVGDCIVHRLCGRMAHEPTSAGIAQLYNARLSDYDPDVLRLLRLQSSQLPQLIPADQPAGFLLPQIADKLGLPSNIPVSAALHDQYAAALGIGAVSPGQVMFGAGTAWVLLALMRHWSEPASPDAFVCAHCCPGLFGQILSLRTGGTALHFMQNLTGQSQASGPLENGLASIPPGSDGLLCLPFFQGTPPAGIKLGCRGAILGLQSHHTPAHVVRATVEGLVFELNRHLGFVKRAETALSRIVMCGGAASGDVVPQMVSDVTGLPVACAGESESSALGAAIVARKLVEPQFAWQQLVTCMVPAPRLFLPGSQRSIYQEGFERFLESLRQLGLLSSPS
ncbi:MAG TPA: FGGY-family carbohydrate kinase [Verrucomicrobiota bacterium]|nr:FGGY-family carbohydrate kinase [Verrucomicrobiota bacterium]